MENIETGDVSSPQDTLSSSDIQLSPKYVSAQVKAYIPLFFLVVFIFIILFGFMASHTIESWLITIMGIFLFGFLYFSLVYRHARASRESFYFRCDDERFTIRGTMTNQKTLVFPYEKINGIWTTEMAVMRSGRAIGGSGGGWPLGIYAVMIRTDSWGIYEGRCTKNCRLHPGKEKTNRPRSSTPSHTTESPFIHSSVCDFSHRDCLGAYSFLDSLFDEDIVISPSQKKHRHKPVFF